jgi:hypothetical protein
MPGSPATPTPRPTVTAQWVGVLLPAARTIQPPDLNVPLEFWPLGLALLVLLGAFLLDRGHAHR